MLVGTQCGGIQKELNKYVTGNEHHQKHSQQSGNDTVQEMPVVKAKEQQGRLDGGPVERCKWGDGNFSD